MNKAEIIQKLKPIVDRPDSCGFDAYLVAREEPRLKHLRLSITNLQASLKTDITSIIRERYIAEDAIYTSADNVADNQVKFYVIPETGEYKPFDISAWTQEEFKEEHLDGFMGFFFHFRYDQQDVWCYQNRRSITITNRKNTNKLARIKRYDNGWVFEEQNEKIVNFAHAIDIIVLDGNLITSDVGLLERSFDFQIFINQRAKEVADSLIASNLFSGMEKLNGYLASDPCVHRRMSCRRCSRVRR